ncbi:MAG TPA: hypothetical protein DHV28_17910 [Ignavibacteriales bacterium]|nr:hypothetical protein [Ignavibacteriales bacterium]
MFNLVKYISIFFLVSVNCYSQNNIKILDKAGFENLISQRSNKILLLNIWATWCVPCREEFPDLIKLNDIFKDKVDIIGISVDYPDEINSKIKPFAERLKINFNLFVNGIGNDEELINLVDKDWNGAIPATFIFDIDGKLVSKIYGKQDFESFKEIITKLIK